jgi:endoglucanase
MKNEIESEPSPDVSPSKLSRRRLLKGLTTAAAVAVLPDCLINLAAQTQNLAPQAKQPTSLPAQNPRWYGFNLLEYFSTDPDWMKYFPYKNDGMFPEDDYRWIRDWGFNWVRLPMDYRFWTDPNDLLKIHDDKIEPIDRAIRLGEKYGVHVNICLHRAPGYCILDTMNEALTGIHITKEKTSVYTDPHTLDAFVHQWVYFAERYKGIPNERLSFNLVNEPLVLPPPAPEHAQMHAGQEAKESDSDYLRRHGAEYSRVAKAAADGIRAKDAQRWIVTDGYPGGFAPIPDRAAANMLQSAHTYNPMPLTHYQCEWARGIITGKEPVPTWPLKDAWGKVICDRQVQANTFRPWGDLAQEGVPIHFGEMGCYKHTPPAVVLAWFNDTLEEIGTLNSGWALWNFRGPFGVLDTERTGTKFEDWHGHQLDRPLLTLLQDKIKT